MQSIRILGTGSYVPSKVLSNFDLEKTDIDTSDEWIIQRTGIRERRIAAPDEASSDMAAKAAQKALDMAGLSAKDLDHIIVPTVTPDYCCPAASNLLQAHLDAPQAKTFDITAACSGFVYGLDVAIQYLKTGASKTVLVAASEVMTRTVNWKDRSTCILWGDGSGAAILRLGDQGPELLTTHIHTDGASGSDILLPGGGSRTTPISHESVDKGAHYLDLISGNQSFRVAVRRFIEAIEESCAANNITPEDINWFIPHQANLRMFQWISKSLKIPMERFYITIHKYGNISSASCAIAMDEAVRDGSIQKGDIVCLPVFGGGLTWGSALIRWQ